MKNIEEIERILTNVKDIVRKEYKAEIIGLFGSYVRCEQKETSDIDILVKFYEGATLFDLTGLAEFLEEQLQIRVDIVPIDALRKEIKERVLKEVIYL